MCEMVLRSLWSWVSFQRIQLHCTHKESVLRIDHRAVQRGAGGFSGGLCCQLGRAGSVSVGGFSGRRQGRAKVEDRVSRMQDLLLTWTRELSSCPECRSSTQRMPEMVLKSQLLRSCYSGLLREFRS